jgi:hypothetical protein
MAVVWGTRRRERMSGVEGGLDGRLKDRRRVKDRGKSLVNGSLYGRGVKLDLLVYLERRWNRQSRQLLAMIPSHKNKITENKKQVFEEWALYRSRDGDNPLSN